MSSCRLKKQFFPTLTCGVFVFSAVSAPSSFFPPACPPILPHTISSSITSKYITHTHTSHTQYHEASHPIHHSHTHTSSLTLTHTHVITHTHITHTHTHPTHNIIKHHIQYITHTHTSHTQYHQASHPIHHSHTHHSLTHVIRGQRCPSGVLWSPPLCRWLLRGRRGTWCTAKGSDVRPGVLPVSIRCPLVSAALPVAFAWQAWDLVHCKGVGCTPRIPV